MQDSGGASAPTSLATRVDGMTYFSSRSSCGVRKAGPVPLEPGRAIGSRFWDGRAERWPSLPTGNIGRHLVIFRQHRGRPGARWRFSSLTGAGEAAKNLSGHSHTAVDLFSISLVDANTATVVGRNGAILRTNTGGD